MPTDNPRFTITVTPEMLRAIDDFRYENRIPTRSQAVNKLFKIALKEALEELVQDDGKLVE